MRYYLDEEFIEDSKTIDLVSIGMIAEDGREYYAQSVEFDVAKASPWVREHVLSQIKTCSPTEKWNLDISLYSWNRCGKADCPWRRREEIRDEVLAFMDIEQYGEPEIWTYYGSYDHVAFCQLFGTMMDLPKGFPMHMMDLKQWCKMLGNPQLPEQGKGEHNALADARWNKAAWEFLSEYEEDLGIDWTPTQLEELQCMWNALVDSNGGSRAVITTVEAKRQLHKLGLLHAGGA